MDDCFKNLELEYSGDSEDEVVLEEDATSRALRQHCYDRPLAVVQGLPAALGIALGIGKVYHGLLALGIDLSVFSSKTLKASLGDTQLTVYQQQGQEDRKEAEEPKTIQWFVQQQVASCDVKGIRTEEGEAEIKEGETSENQPSKLPDDKATWRGSVEIPTEGADVNWSRQREELQKLPEFLTVTSHAFNMLTHCSHSLPGMTGVRLEMLTPGAHTPLGRGASFCSGVHVNVGPADCQWHAVPFDQQRELTRLIRRAKGEGATSPLWPCVEELQQNRIRVYCFRQSKGEVVWLGPGTYYCMRALGVCNALKWSLVPMTLHQYRMAVTAQLRNNRRTGKAIREAVEAAEAAGAPRAAAAAAARAAEWGGGAGVLSAPVPMLHVTWSIVQSELDPVSDPALREKMA
ncbi:hypothetical protein ACOMHN_056556 [Nucella lapillus]